MDDDAWAEMDAQRRAETERRKAKLAEMVERMKGRHAFDADVCAHLDAQESRLRRHLDESLILPVGGTSAEYDSLRARKRALAPEAKVLIMKAIEGQLNDADRGRLVELRRETEGVEAEIRRRFLAPDA